ncbi:MAG: 1-(5-phosphoribosyl)-5-[(5-phosphoribosylamino)methylideneamino]imidazole-4-carboxamide isomerase [Cyclobacteriaceae bacterium]|jgi:phosphoribosylformimino-5-aminoimidazole carboxamide ribotide isomerase|nr:1-(5-phosphoribosyl)-5-[(5-phosphoribosylamino)methylideneamino]imidazole-4-carboxamide isomerase [Cytophagales bacterium]HNP78168.1 1-(5-phosphoribosyl)-5-[(5-phosphoribosylamino)methylideneamino]imidazole-4-carboxamide isomerase [Cyclobacteriaceae bacterium]HQQ82933.1 1-(5-phosphoribosyl)-5-[(5-phosphoribosylamino)methylideneamino]imidazole-4-carboxamide isomerase [Cyclobacteriaceae bacterium]
MKIIPAIDIIGGKCVRLTQGDYGKMKVYRENPVEVAKEFEAADLEYLHLVDLDGAKKGRVVNWKIIESIQAETALKVDFGGGVKTEQEVEELLDLGIEQINIGSMAVRNPELFINLMQQFGPENFILSTDVKNELIQMSGWTEETPVTVYSLVNQFISKGLEYISCTDIHTDGMLQGPNFGLYKKLKSRFPELHIIASGGISSLKDLEELNYLKIHGAIVGKAIYENKIKLSELKKI